MYNLFNLRLNKCRNKVTRDLSGVMRELSEVTGDLYEVTRDGLGRKELVN